MGSVIALFLLGLFVHERLNPALGVVIWTITGLGFVGLFILASKGQLLHQRVAALEKKLAQKAD